ncbi:hypothetical protein A6V25_34080 [Nostoc sp. ATCC 53789]|nr:hypothetical protein A6V25_34080 [Nostoc sp. ATCC 53789]
MASQKCKTVEKIKYQVLLIINICMCQFLIINKTNLIVLLESFAALYLNPKVSLKKVLVRP